MRSSGLRALRRALQSEPEVAELAERLLAAGPLAASPAATIAAMGRHEAALQRLAPRLFSTLAGGGGRLGGAAARQGSLAGRLLQQHGEAQAQQQVRQCFGDCRGCCHSGCVSGTCGAG